MEAVRESFVKVLESLNCQHCSRVLADPILLRCGCAACRDCVASHQVKACCKKQVYESEKNNRHHLLENVLEQVNFVKSFLDVNESNPVKQSSQGKVIDSNDEFAPNKDNIAESTSASLPTLLRRATSSTTVDGNVNASSITVPVSSEQQESQTSIGASQRTSQGFIWGTQTQDNCRYEHLPFQTDPSFVKKTGVPMCPAVVPDTYLDENITIRSRQEGLDFALSTAPTQLSPTQVVDGDDKNLTTIKSTSKFSHQQFQAEVVSPTLDHNHDLANSKDVEHTKVSAQNVVPDTLEINNILPLKRRIEVGSKANGIDVDGWNSLARPVSRPCNKLHGENKTADSVRLDSTSLTISAQEHHNNDFERDDSQRDCSTASNIRVDDESTSLDRDTDAYHVDSFLDNTGDCGDGVKGCDPISDAYAWHMKRQRLYEDSLNSGSLNMQRDNSTPDDTRDAAAKSPCHPPDEKERQSLTQGYEETFQNGEKDSSETRSNATSTPFDNGKYTSFKKEPNDDRDNPTPPSQQNPLGSPNIFSNEDEKKSDMVAQNPSSSFNITGDSGTKSCTAEASPQLATWAHEENRLLKSLIGMLPQKVRGPHDSLKPVELSQRVLATESGDARIAEIKKGTKLHDEPKPSNEGFESNLARSNPIIAVHCSSALLSESKKTLLECANAGVFSLLRNDWTKVGSSALSIVSLPSQGLIEHSQEISACIVLVEAEKCQLFSKHGKSSIYQCKKTLSYFKGICMGYWIIDASRWLKACQQEKSFVKLDDYEVTGCFGGMLSSAPKRARLAPRMTDDPLRSTFLAKYVFLLRNVGQSPENSIRSKFYEIEIHDIAFMIHFSGGDMQRCPDDINSIYICSSCHKSSQEDKKEYVILDCFPSPTENSTKEKWSHSKDSIIKCCQCNGELTETSVASRTLNHEAFPKVGIQWLLESISNFQLQPLV